MIIIAACFFCQAELGKNYAEVEIPRYLGYLEKMIKENGTGYIVGDKVRRLNVYLIVICHFYFTLSLRNHNTHLIPTLPIYGIGRTIRMVIS